MQRIGPILLLSVAILAGAWYTVEPWALTFIDEGPYYSEEFTGSFDLLAVESVVELRRYGRTVFTLESRRLPDENESVLVLRTKPGDAVWVRRLIKPDGELGAVRLRKAEMTWYGGWCVGISPENQESGQLYLGRSGGFRFFNHSW